MESRYEVKLEQYSKIINIEARTMLRMARQMYLPAISDYAAAVAGNISAIRALLQARRLWPRRRRSSNSPRLGAVYTLIQELIDLVEKAREIEDAQAQARCLSRRGASKMEELRAVVDKLERIVDDTYWPVPGYNKILFYV